MRQNATQPYCLALQCHTHFMMSEQKQIKREEDEEDTEEDESSEDF